MNGVGASCRVAVGAFGGRDVATGVDDGDPSVVAVGAPAGRGGVGAGPVVPAGGAVGVDVELVCAGAPNKATGCKHNYNSYRVVWID